MKTVTDFMDRDVQKRPRLGNFGWIAKTLEFGEELLVILYGAYILGKGVGNTLVAPENNGIAIFDGYGLSLGEFAREASGYFGPSDKQLETFEKLAQMTQGQVRAWAKLGLDPNKLQYKPSCPECGHDLYLQVEVTHDVPFTVSLNGSWNYHITDINTAVIKGCHMMYCPNCGAEWHDSDMDGVPVLKEVK